jgi:hypothetical protein
MTRSASSGNLSPARARMRDFTETGPSPSHASRAVELRSSALRWRAEAESHARAGDVEAARDARAASDELDAQAAELEWLASERAEWWRQRGERAAVNATAQVDLSATARGPT